MFIFPFTPSLSSTFSSLTSTSLESCNSNSNFPTTKTEPAPPSPPPSSCTCPHDQNRPPSHQSESPHRDEGKRRWTRRKSYSWSRGGGGGYVEWFLVVMVSTFVIGLGMAKLANNTEMSNSNLLGQQGGKLSSHYTSQQQSDNFISCHFNPLCFCKYDQKTEIYDSIRKLWQMVGFNQTNFFTAVRSLLHHMKHQPTTIYYITEAELNNFAWLLVNASLSPVPLSPAYLVEPGPVFDIECADVPIALIPTEYNAHGVISHVSVSGSKLSMLDGSAFAGLEIQGIQLSRDQLYFISEYAFSSMSNSLSMLDLSGNFLDDVPFAAFKNFRALEWINLSNNLVNSVAGDWFSVPISLRKLLLSANSIDSLPYKLLASFPRLHWLDLSSNFIRNLTQDNLPPNLQTLNLMKNRLTRFPVSVFHLSSLSWLLVGGCAIETVPQDWPLGVPPRQMNQLDMSENFIQHLPSRPFASQLSVLDLSMNKNYLKSIPAAAFFGMNIFRLSLGHNRIHMIDPGAFLSLHSTLKYLNLENNALRAIPWSSLSNLTSLMHLYIGSNAIQDDGVDSLQGDGECKLTYLGLNGNQLTRIPKKLLTKCPHLFHLNLGYNQISHLDDLLHLIPTSSSSSYSSKNNNVNGSGGTTRLRRLRNLNTLILRNNPIRTLSYTHNDLSNVVMGSERDINVRRSSDNLNSNFNNINTNQINEQDLDQQQQQLNTNNNINFNHLSPPSITSSLPTDASSNELLASPSIMEPGPTSHMQPSGGSPTAGHGHLHGRGPGKNRKQSVSDSSENSENGNGNGHNGLPVQPGETLASTTFKNIFRSEVFPNLQELSLSFCQITGELEPFPSLPLITLEISNGLKTAKTLHPAIFNSLRNLQWLALDHNCLSRVSFNTFYSNRRLNYVNLEFNRLTVLPPQMFHPDIHQVMTQLRLSHNRLTTLHSETFISFPAINLDLSYNQITTIEKHAFTTALPVTLSSGGGVGGGNGGQSRTSSGSSSSKSGQNHDSSYSSGGAFSSINSETSSGNGGGGRASVASSGTLSSSTTSTTLTGGGGTSTTTGTAGGGGGGMGMGMGSIGGISVIAGGDEAGLNVYLHHNLITTVRAGAFSQEKFQLIDLSYNLLVSFNLDVFGRRTIIESLNVSHNSLERLNLKQRWARNHIIKFLDLSYNKITFRGIDFTSLCITRLLDLSHNRIDRTDAKIFPANCSLKELNLAANAITSLEPGSFANLRDLTILNLSENQIVLLPPVIFIRNTKLRYLDLSSNRLRSLPRDSLVGSSVEILNLGSNEFVNLPVGALSQISRRLRRLDISHNSLEHLDSTMFESIAGLVHLNLSHNRLSILPDNAFANLASLRELDLSFNFLRANFKELFHFLPKLKLLRLCGCGIKVLPFLPLPHLVSLELSENGLMDIKMQSLGSLSRLRHLDLSHNELTNSRIPSWTPLYNLVTLKLNSNPLKSLTKDTFYGLGRLENLEILNISRLDRFDTEVLSQMNNLRSLAVETHPAIEKFRFRLGTILSSLPHLEELKVVIKESTLSDQLIGIKPKLRKLTITGEKLKRIESNALDGIENCFHIDLAITNTSIDDIPSKIFDKLQSAAWARLDLSHNKMTSLDSFAFYPSPNRSVWFSRGTKVLEGGLVLDHNDWACDCNMVSLAEWLRRWLRESFQSHSTDNIPLVHSMYESLRVPTCTDVKGKIIPIIELYSDTMCHASALSSGYSSLLSPPKFFMTRQETHLHFVTTILSTFSTILFLLLLQSFIHSSFLFTLLFPIS